MGKNRGCSEDGEEPGGALRMGTVLAVHWAVLRMEKFWGCTEGLCRRGSSWPCPEEL